VERLDTNFFQGTHQGFGAVHRRTLRLSENGLDGLDECKAEGEKRVYFHLLPGWGEPKGSNLSLVEVTNGYQKIQFISSDGHWEIQDGLYSSEYGRQETSKVLVLISSRNKITWKIQSVSYGR